VKETPEFTLKINPDIQNVKKKKKLNLKCTLPALAHKKLKDYALFATSF